MGFSSLVGRWSTAPHRWARPDGVEQRPVAILQHMALRIGWPRLQSERTDDAIVAIVTLQDDPGERRYRDPALGAQFHRHRLTPCRVETGKRPLGDARELVECLPYQVRVAAECGHDVGLDHRIIGARHMEFRAGWDHHTRDGAQIFALSWGEGTRVRHS